MYPHLLLPMFEAALAGEISYGQNMSVRGTDCAVLSTSTVQ